jgi:hypothetical protein
MGSNKQHLDKKLAIITVIFGMLNERIGNSTVPAVSGISVAIRSSRIQDNPGPTAGPEYERRNAKYEKALSLSSQSAFDETRRKLRTQVRNECSRATFANSSPLPLLSLLVEVTLISVSSHFGQNGPPGTFGLHSCDRRQ